MANSRELAEQAFSLLQDALKDSEARAAELDAELRKERTPRNSIEEHARVLEHRLDSIEAEREQWKREATQLAEVLENERVKLRKLKKRLEVAESGPGSVDKKEVNFWRAKAEEFDKETKEYKQRIAALRKELNSRPEEGDAIDPALLEQLETARHEALELRATVASLRDGSAESDKTRAHAENLVRERDARLAEQTARIAALGGEIAELKGKIGSHNAALGDLSARLGERDAEIARQLSANEALGYQVDELKAANDRLSAELAERDRKFNGFADAAREAEQEKQSIRDQIAGLEDELKEEKECTVNLSQIANERREQITQLSEKLDEALERLAEAKWKLERAGRFERLVTKRRKLIDKLLEAIRAKQKSNVALKAGIDGLRKFKAKSEQQQQKQLVQIEELTAEIKETEERQAGKASKDAAEKLRKSEESIRSLETRLEAQAKLIETLESDLSSARASRHATESQSRELGETRAALEKKDATIARLEADLDEQQKQLGKLRGSESETLRLKAVQERDHSLIEGLEHEIKELNEELGRLREAAAGGTHDASAHSAAEIRRRDAQISDLRRAAKDQEKEIARLKEAVAGWQKKYEFLSAEPPSAYQATTPPAKQPVNS